ncbi:MAG: DinB family protein [Gemmatimonadota bacterium]|nr:DinB family protein [Gemmatimonadota bacterium]
MNWNELLRSELEAAYHATEGLIGLVDGDLDWKPQPENNWMSMGQLLMHITNACGATFKGFVTGDWGMPEGMDPENMPEDAMLPPAEAMPSVESVAQARELLTADKRLAIEMLEQAASRMDEPTPAPWAPDHPSPLGQQLLGMINHLTLHKSQLYYYLKLQGKPVNTYTLFGMAAEPAGA